MSRVEAGFNAVFQPAWNPFYHLGALTIYFFWIVLVSGIYVFIFFETSVFGAWQSVERMTHDQWYLAGVMRSLHRYASDAAVVTLALHMIKEFSKDRYRGPRWFSWFTGVPLLWMIFPLGISGYWLVWDELAHYIAIVSSELLDVLPLFTDPMAANFLTPDSLSDRFFTLMGFVHLIGLPIFLVFGIWFHVLRISRPRVNPPRRLAVGALAALLVLSLVKPAVSHAPADLTTVPGELHLDWFYLPAYPLLDLTSPTTVWLVLVGFSMVLALLPWVPPLRRPTPAVVDLPNCNGCGRCVEDCPFAAVALQPRSDGLKFSHEAVVSPELCTGCGICTGACPTATPHRRRSALTPGIEVPDRPVAQLRDELLAGTEKLQGPARVVVYGCECGPDPAELAGPGVSAQVLPCMAMLPPSFIDFALTRGHADGVLLMGCREGDCHFRLGTRWTDQRIVGERDPYLRKRVPAERVGRAWLGDAGLAERRAALEAFRARLRDMEATAPAAADAGASPGSANAAREAGA